MAKKLLVASAFLLLSIDVEGGNLAPPPELEEGYFGDSKTAAEYAATALHFLNELSSRRRLTTVFPNEQSPFYGVQINYVNVGRGNMTFLMRDLVRLDRIPIVFGRVYDSRKQDEADFGRGWKLSVAETLRMSGGSLIYVDASHSQYELQLDGARISTAHPHLTGIRRGRLNATEALLEVGNLTKVFHRHGDDFRLVEVRDTSGNWVRLSYSGDVIARISSSGQRHVDLVRDAGGRILRATDDAGRSIQYVYDSYGRLSESYDLAGEAYRYGYDDGGYMSALVDPRGEQVLVARFDEAGRVIEIASQHDEMAVEYSAGSSLVTNAMQQAARFHHHATGLTETIQDFGGGVSALEFDAGLQVSQFIFDGEVVARAQYGGGRLLAVSKVDGGSFRTRRFAYDSFGRLVWTGEPDERDTRYARYAYDVRGNVVFADDELGKREYRYGDNGSLIVAELDGFRLDIQNNEIGMVERVFWDSGAGSAHEHGGSGPGNAGWRSLDISYNDTDRVSAVRFSTPHGSVTSDYGYTDRGFRASARYDLWERAGNAEARLSYDTVGNLLEWTYPGLNGSSHSVRHTVGPQNQVLTVTPVGYEQFEHTVDYDANGRPVRVAQGARREAAFRYDDLGRLTDVFLDGKRVLTADHGPMDVDPVQAADKHTQFTAVSQPVASGVFASLEEIAFARAAGTPYTIVRFAPTMGRFIIRDPVVAPPDAVALASLMRRNLASPATLDPAPLVGFDKPSSSFFIPPEYFSVNCFSCQAGAISFELNRVGSGPINVGQTVSFVADAASSVCTVTWYDPETFSQYTEPWRFSHEIRVNDSYVTTLYGPVTWYNQEYLQFNLSFPSVGTKTVKDILRCTGCPTIFFTQAQTNLSVVSVIPFTIRRHTTVDLTAGQADSILQSASSLLQTNHGDGDVACPIVLQRSGSIPSFSVGNGIIDTQPALDAVIGVPGRVKVVKEITFCTGSALPPAGETIRGCSNRLGIVLITAGPLQDYLWAHEYAHNQDYWVGAHSTDPNSLGFGRAVMTARNITQGVCDGLRNPYPFP